MSSFLAKTYNASIDTAGGMIAVVGKRRPSRFSYLSEFLSRVPFAFGWKLRRAVYSRILPNVGKDVVLLHGVVIDDVRTTLGDDIWISVGTYLDYVIVEDHVLIGQHVVLLSGKNHHNIDRLDIPIKLQGNPPKEPITIGRGAWIGANATVMADVGHDAIVGAGSVVTKPVPPFAIVAGNPAKVIRMRK
ncbi:MAG: acyltransferase [Acidobacteria bacterium ACB1]|nr:acyltransferase [Acidobacteria bacterium ACB1]